jgi:hypothetical protein
MRQDPTMYLKSKLQLILESNYNQNFLLVVVSQASMQILYNNRVENLLR